MADDPWEAAFAAYRQSLVDYNGDGIPDAVVRMPQGMVTSTPPPTATGQDRRQIQRRGMAGLEPTEQQNALLRASMPQLEANSERLGNFGMELTGIPQVLRAGTSIGEAYTDPSLGNVANAGLQSALAAVPFMPMKYAAPIIGTSIGVDLGSSQASAQTSGIEQRLRQMSPQDLMAYQRTMGVAADGKIGPNTVSAAARFEEQQRAAQRGEAGRIEAQGRADAARESGRIEAQGRADAARQSGRIEAQAKADIQRQKAESELRATDAQRPFLQRFPEYSNIAPWAAGAAAAAIPMAGALLTRRGATAPMRQQARSIDASVGAFNAAPTPLAARTVAEASAAPAAAPSGISGFWNRLMDAGSIGVGAAMPSAAVVAPSFIDYMQPSGSQAKEQAAQEFTLDKLRERMTGPFALGLAMAGGGRFIGEKAGAAFMNPAPRGANAAQAQAITGMVKQAGGDDTALANNLMNSFRGGQTAILEGKRMQGAAAAKPPYVRMNDIEISSAPTRSGQGTRSAALSRPQKLDIQSELLSGSSVNEIAQKYGASATSIAAIEQRTQQLVKAAGGDPGEALRRLQAYRSARDYSYAIPAAIGGGVAAEGPMNRLMQNYQGGDYY